MNNQFFQYSSDNFIVSKGSLVYIRWLPKTYAITFNCFPILMKAIMALSRCSFS